MFLRIGDRRRFVPKAAGLVVLAIVGSTAIAASSAAASGGTITVGYEDALSGSLAAVGEAGLTQAQAAIHYINATGGVGGKKIVLSVLDTGEVGSGKAGSDAEQFAQKKVVAILGPTVSNDCASAQPIVTQANIPEQCLTLTPAEINTPGSYTFGGSPAEVTTVKPMIDFAHKLKGSGTLTAAVIGNDVAGVELWEQKFKNIAARNGIKLVYQGSMSESATSVGTYVSQILTAKPDIVFSDVDPQFGVPLAQALRGGGFKGPVINQLGSIDYAGLASIKDPGIYSLSGADYLLPGVSKGGDTAKLLAAEKAAGNTTAAKISLIDGTSDLLPMLDVLKTLQACGASCTGKQLAQRLTTTTTTIPGLGSFGYTAQVHEGVKAIHFWHWDGSNSTATQAAEFPVGSISATKP